jgi:methionyl-tRNA formyltransferase
MRLVFFGTPDFAVPSLSKLINEPGIEVLALVTQPDKAVGRKQVITAPATKILAKKHNIRVLQPEKLNQIITRPGEFRSEDNMIKTLSELKPDFLVTCAYGQILKQDILDIAPVINLHASLLPDYRGPAPINWMLIHGETRVGVTTMLSDPGVDTGDILLKSEIDIDEKIKSDELAIKLSELGAELLIKTLKNFSSILPTKQNPAQDSSKQLAPFMDKKLGEIDFRQESFSLRSANPRQSEFKLVLKNSAKNIHNLIRASYPWPGAYFMRNSQKIIILDSDYDANSPMTSNPGQITSINKQDSSFRLQCQEGELIIKTLKVEGKNSMSALAFLNGFRLKPGDYLN